MRRVNFNPKRGANHCSFIKCARQREQTPIKTQTHRHTRAHACRNHTQASTSTSKIGANTLIKSKLNKQTVNRRQRQIHRRAPQKASKCSPCYTLALIATVCVSVCKQTHITAVRSLALSLRSAHARAPHEISQNKLPLHAHAVARVYRVDCMHLARTPVS